ncbi:hypothetical protein HYX08_02700 [Candidatus Woesearchaeota archaeon]|nr:hypothetical protein [Candidatus Woesearchaeota archaeon]
MRKIIEKILHFPREIYAGLIFVTLIGFILPPFLKRYDVTINQQYFWTLSSLVQGFAALFSIIVVVIIFRFEYLSLEKKNLIEGVKMHNMTYKEDLEFLNDGELLNYCNQLESQLKNLNKNSEDSTLEYKIKSLIKILTTKEKFKHKFFQPAIIACSTILLSIVGLVFAPLFSNTQLWSILILAFLFAVWSLTSLIRFIRDLLISD